MTLEELKKILEKAKFSPASAKAIEEIMTAAVSAGGITKEEKARLLGIVDLEMETANIEASFLEEVAAALQEYIGDLDKVILRQQPQK